MAVVVRVDTVGGDAKDDTLGDFLCVDDVERGDRRLALVWGVDKGVASSIGGMEPFVVAADAEDEDSYLTSADG